MGFVGDVLVHRDDPGEVFRDVREILRAPQITFANLEGAYTDDPRFVPSAAAPVSAPAHNLGAYRDAGFDVMSMANNHTVDAGYEAMLDTRARLRAQGIQTCGAGDDVTDAHEPAVIEADGVSVAFLAYASTFAIGCEARSDRPGIAAMRAYNFYHAAIDYHTPGSLPVVTTVPDQGDLARMTEDIRRARERADLVITSFHWGDQSRPFHLSDHETRTARYCIDQGADMVVAHHHHALRGMEWYRGKPIMYGLGHFVFDMRVASSAEEYRRKLREWDPAGHYQEATYSAGWREGWPLLPMHADTRMTCVAWAKATKDAVTDIGFLPCHITSDGLVHPLRPGTPEGDQVIGYVEECLRSEHLASRIVSEGAVRLAGYETLRIVPA